MTIIKLNILIKLEAYQIAELGVARTFQNTPDVSKTMTVEQDIGWVSIVVTKTISFPLYYPQVLDIFQNQKKSVVFWLKTLLNLFELNSIRNTIVSNLPLGYQRKVELVRALATTPKLLLLDEPAAGLMSQRKKNFECSSIRFWQLYRYP